MKKIILSALCVVGLIASALDVTVSGRTGADIQQAIDRVASAGGGRVTVPTGNYEVASIRLASHVELHLAKGSVLRGVTDGAKYDDFPDAVCSIHPEGSPKVLLQAWNAVDIAVTGEGMIDGQGPKFFDVKSARGHYPKPPRSRKRPLMVEFVKCKGVRLQGVTFKDSPCWTMLVRLCEDVMVDGITVVGDQRMINNDGIDFDACRRVRVGNSTFKTGDDCLILRSIREEGSNQPVVCEDVVVSNCTLNSTCQTIRLGCPSDDTIRNAVFKDIVASGNNGIFADYPVRYLRDGDEGRMDISNILVENYSGTFYGSAVQIVSQPGVKVHNVDAFTFRNLKVKSAQPLRFVGNKGVEIKSVLLENVQADVAGNQTPYVAKGCQNLVFKNVSFRGKPAPDGRVVAEEGSSAPLVRGKSVSWETGKGKAKAK